LVFRQNFDAISEKLSSSSLASALLMAGLIISIISRFCTTERADEVEAFFTAHPLPNSARRINQSIENMRTSGKMLNMIAKSKLAEEGFW
jgi:hypothetical protein